MLIKFFRSNILIVMLALLLAACGGGSGSDNNNVFSENRNQNASEEEPTIAPKLVSGALNACLYETNNLRCWGGNDSGQLAINGEFTPEAVSIGHEHICIIDNNEVICAGSNNNDMATPPTGLIAPHSLSLGKEHSCVIDNGQVHCWGSDNNGILSNIPEMNNPTALASGDNHICVLDDNGMQCWGSNSHGQTIVPTELSNISDIHAAYLQTCAQQGDGLICWGDNEYGQTNIPRTFTNLQSVEMGVIHTCIMDDLGIECWGYNEDGRSTVPGSITHPTRLATVAHSSCVLQDNEIMCWGNISPWFEFAMLDKTEITFLETARFDNTTISLNLAEGSVLRIPDLISMDSTTFTLKGKGQLETGSISTINNTKFFLSENATFSGITATSYNTTDLCQDGFDHEIINLSGGSTLDMSSVEMMTVGSHCGQTAFGSTDSLNPDGQSFNVNNSTWLLDGLIEINNNGGGHSNNYVHFAIDATGTISTPNLSVLSSHTNNPTTHFIPTDKFSFPKITGSTTGMTINVASGGYLEIFASYLENSSITVEAGGFLYLPNAVQFQGYLTIQDNGTIDAPNLTDISYSDITLVGTDTFNSGALDNIDQTRWFLSNDAAFSNISATTYSTTGLCRDGIKDEIINLSGGSTLDMSSVGTLTVGSHCGQTAFGSTNSLNPDGQHFIVQRGSWLLDGLTLIDNQSSRTNNYVHFEATNTGSISMLNLPKLINHSNNPITTFTSSEAGSKIDVPLLCEMSNTMLEEIDGGVILNDCP